MKPGSKKKTSTWGTQMGKIRRDLRKQQSPDKEEYNQNGSQDGEYGWNGDSNMSSSCPPEGSRAKLKLRNESGLQMH